MILKGHNIIADKVFTFRASVKFLVFLFTLVVYASLTGKSYATQMNVCNPPQTMYGNIRDSFFKDIRETTTNHLTSVTTDFAFQLGTGSEMSQWVGCTGSVIDPGACSSEVLSTASNCTPSNPELCDGLYNQYRADIGGGRYAANNSQLVQSPVGGSLLGVAYVLHNTIVNEPVPLNYAYFFQDYARRIPIIGEKAYAQEYTEPLVDEIYDAWAIIRNMAFGFMAIIILVVGIMMVTRKRLSQQVVVNVQYALPKIVVSMFLIAFSYPIGAVLASLGWKLFNSGEAIVISLLGTNFFSCATDLVATGKVIGVIITGLLLGTILMGGVGIFITVGVVILVLVFIFAYFFVIIKAFIIYLKMLFETIAAPLYFVYGAIPGNDDQTFKWFKKMAAYCISLFLMGIAINMVIMLAASVLFNIDGPIWSGIWVILAGPILAIAGMIFAARIPDMVMGTLMETRGRR